MSSDEEPTFVEFWVKEGFKTWNSLTDEEKAKIRSDTMELTGADDDEYASFVWVKGYKNHWYFMDPKVDPRKQA